MKALEAVLDGTADNHILPFLWIHGEDEETLVAEVDRIHACGIGALCVEARPHVDFNGPRWFRDLGVILDRCKHWGMQMWLLDDSHFPTGYANGEVKRAHPELCKRYLSLKTYDLVGPLPGSGMDLSSTLGEGDRLVGAFLQAREGFEDVDVARTIDLTAALHYVSDYNTGKPKTDVLGNPVAGTCGKTPMLSFDLPDGAWCLNVLVESSRGGERETEGYLNPLVGEATDVLLETVYQPVFEHFGHEFGKTFRGFFSDEPRFGNIHGSEEASIGRNSAMALPWRDGMIESLVQRCQRLGGILASIDGRTLRYCLPLLFIGDNELAHALRYAYMDLVSQLYSDNFDGRISTWCHTHGCEHIGHTIEDNGAYSRLGYGAGHIFRAMAHADMAGIDVVIHQLMPGMGEGLYKGMHRPGWDGTMFTHLLGKLGGSLAHLDATKHGRCMCELFGAYGWAEGNRLSKWLVDYMLVRGVNNLVPHAFNAKAFPDEDCPPHFCAQNPQMPEFPLLMGYANRLCELLSNGTACPDVALYINCEGEWSGRWQPTEEVAERLSRANVDFDLISADFLAEAEAREGRLCINDLEMGGLILPWAEALPRHLLSDVLRLAEGGVNVWFVHELPTRCSQGDDTNLLASLRVCETIHIVELAALSDALAQQGIPEIRPSSSHPYLRRYRYRHEDGEVFLFVNEGPSARIQTSVEGCPRGVAYEYDAFSNTALATRDVWDLDLPPYGSKVVVAVESPLEGVMHVEPDRRIQKIADLGPCVVTLKPAEGSPVEAAKLTLDHPGYVSSQDGYECFSGRLTYSFEVELRETTPNMWVVLEGIREGATVRINDVFCGTRICPDYHYEARGLVEGRNIIEVELNTTLARQMHDFLSGFMPLEPVGLTGAWLGSAPLPE